MKSGQDVSAFRAQLVVPEQRQLYDYWLAKSGLGKAGLSGLPCRADIKPTEIPRLLAGISLIDVAEAIPDCRVRLAGTRMRDVFDREITGLTLADLDWCDKWDYWIAAFERTIHEGQPTQGVVVAPRKQKEHLVQYWLRLPLQTGGGKVGMVLCYDHFLTASDRYEDELAAIA